MLTLDMDMRPIEQLENDLDRLKKEAMPAAVWSTLNTGGFKISDLSRKSLKRRFLIRNTWTARNIAYMSKRTMVIDDMESAAGSRLEYMAKQEEGFTQAKTGKHGVAIPTGASAGQAGARERTRRIQKRNWLSVANPVRGPKRGRGTTAAAVREAVETGNRIIFIEQRTDNWKRPTGFYRVIGGSKRGSGWPKGARLQMIYQVEKSSVRTDAHEWLMPPTKLVTQKLGQYYRDAIIRQIQRRRMFRDRI